CENWGRIIKDSREMVRGILADAKPSVDGSRLVIVCKDEVSAGSLKGYSEEVSEILRRETKKDMDFDIFGPGRGEDPDTKYPDLTELINFDDIRITD
ncbi:MAG: hypothetical protein II940_03545, partial [Methanosarcinaceae archaeon]|nr:hypothetical protein [Methanosarcinaceae archaeon]